MKIQCHVCEAAEATVLCCADEAPLCRACDEKVHAANKLASKHQRVSLSNSSSQMPNCDICQEMVGYFFCLEDRALLCRKCDVAIHTANPYVSSHQRFLLTGVKVGLEPVEPGSSLSVGKSVSREKVSEAETRSFPWKSAPSSLAGQYEKVAPTQNTAGDDLTPPKRSKTMSPADDYTKMIPVQSGGVDDLTPARFPFAGCSSAGSIPQWHIDDFLGQSEFNLNYGYTDHGSSKADSGKLGESDSSMARSSEDSLDIQDCLGQVPDVAWMVPQVPSPPTASGLYWPDSSRHFANTAAFVPDISSIENRPNLVAVGRRRRQQQFK
ncbi:hypothetical protein Nepgr_027431 [Nepenthes gracilis]|uniref:B box-type domain-containing protein n=1 Tax=Nepenthes gracilis TaxID=150966 RepID=A0AAD3Y1G1_NEPGR|nr:hypothetical protein Nepgr_027431 [Nepenthes gracilis]